jgi:hypothetical protein
VIALSNTRKSRTVTAASVSLAVMVTLVGFGSPTWGATSPTAGATRSLSVTDTARLRYITSSGALLIEEGAATGGLPGTVKARFDVGPTVTSTFTIYTRVGSLIGHGSGTLHGTGLYASFGGTMTVTHGTGHYTHAHGHGGFYGLINRHTYALTVQTTGTLSY